MTFHLQKKITEHQWNDFYNFMIQCCQFYMQHEKIASPMNNVLQRSLISIMGESFKEWAEVYFHQENNSLNQFVVKSDAFDDFKKYAKVTWQMQKFSKAMKAFCELKGYVLDPEEHKNSEGRIIRKHLRPDNTNRAMEMIYIRTTHDPIERPSIPDVKMPDTGSDLFNQISDDQINSTF